MFDRSEYDQGYRDGLSSQTAEYCFHISEASYDECSGESPSEVGEYIDKLRVRIRELEEMCDLYDQSRERQKARIRELTAQLAENGVAP